MSDEFQDEFIKFYKKKIEPFIGLFVLVFLIAACVLVYQDNKLKKEISLNCGYGNDDYTCYCEKSYTDMAKSRLTGIAPPISIINLTNSGERINVSFPN